MIGPAYMTPETAASLLRQSRERRAKVMEERRKREDFEATWEQFARIGFEQEAARELACVQVYGRLG